MAKVPVELKKVKLSDIVSNQNNPRTITATQMESLEKSLLEFPDMVQIREIVLDEDMLCIGGTMRVLALQKIGKKTCTVKIVRGLTPNQKREFILKDNSQFGEWDLEMLEVWGREQLETWGVKLPKEWNLPIPEQNKPIDENAMAETKYECQACGFKW